MAQARSEMRSCGKFDPKVPDKIGYPSQSNLRAHSRIYATCRSQTFCKSLLCLEKLGAEPRVVEKFGRAWKAPYSATVGSPTGGYGQLEVRAQGATNGRE